MLIDLISRIEKQGLINLFGFINNPAVNSGGQSQRHEVLLEKNIDPEEIHAEGVMDATHAQKLFKEVQRKYAS